ncbi:MAG: tetratricopeptide repeat protein [Nitrospiraceae bacterium]|nr:tetratricopeptide repeat protein [Nitrospiraceae bacterium]
MPRVIKKKGRKKEHIGAETEVVDRLADIRDQLRKKQKTVVMYGAAALVVIVAVAGTLLYRQNEAVQERQLEYKAYKLYYSEYQQQPATGPEHFQKALDLFQQAYQRKKTARTLFYIASSYAELGKYDEAQKSLGELIKEYPSATDILPLAYQKLADIQLRAGKKDEALKTLNTLYLSGGSIYKDLALIESARILEGEGKKDEALAKYKELAEKFKDSPYRAEAEAKLGEKKAG